MPIRITDIELVLVINVKAKSPTAGTRTPTANGIWIVSSSQGHLLSTADGRRSGSREGC